MDQEGLSNLALLSIENAKAQKINIDNDFASKKKKGMKLKLI